MSVIAEVPSQGPLIIDLGKQSKKKIKQLEGGEGELASRIEEAVSDAKRALNDPARAANVIPVIVMFEKKPKKRKGIGLLGF